MAKVHVLSGHFPAPCEPYVHIIAIPMVLVVYTLPLANKSLAIDTHSQSLWDYRCSIQTHSFSYLPTLTLFTGNRMCSVIHMENTDDLPGSSVVYVNILAENFVLKEKVAIFLTTNPESPELSRSSHENNSAFRDGDREGLRKKAGGEE